MSFSSILKYILEHGIRIGWSDGKPFDPRDQERTDGMDDIIHAKEKREQEERDRKKKLLKKENTTMGFMDAWKDWSQRQWDNWGSKLQPTYNKIDAWKTPEWVKEMADKVWDLLDDATKKYIYTFIMETLKRFDEEFAKALIQNLIDFVTKWFKGKKKPVAKRR